MITGRGIRYAETHGHNIEKTRARLRRRLADKIIPDVKDQFVFAGFDFLRIQERPIGAAIAVGLRRLQQARLASGERPQLDFHSLRRTTVRGVQNVRT